MNTENERMKFKASERESYRNMAQRWIGSDDGEQQLQIAIQAFRAISFGWVSSTPWEEHLEHLKETILDSCDYLDRGSEGSRTGGVEVRGWICAETNRKELSICFWVTYGEVSEGEDV